MFDSQCTEPVDRGGQFQAAESGEIARWPGVQNVQTLRLDLLNYGVHDCPQRSFSIHEFNGIIDGFTDGSGLARIHDLIYPS